MNLQRAVITKVRATPVRVPAKADSLNSPGILDGDPAFGEKYKTGGIWTDFVHQVKWIVELETSEGECGIGETYRSVAEADMTGPLSRFLGTNVLQLNWAQLPVEDARVYDAFETAVYDLAGRILGLPIHQLLGGAVRDRVECSGWTGRRTPLDAARKAREAMQRGYRAFKFKCADSDPVGEWCRAIQWACGDGIRVVVDPNQRWADVPTTLSMLKDVPPELILGVEDPIQRQDYAGYRELRGQLPIPIFLHVALPYRHQGQAAADVLTAIVEKCADGFNLNGPMHAFVQLAGTAALADLPCWHGSEVDLGILEASALHACAVVPNCTLPSDIFGEMVRVNDLITPGIPFEAGQALVPCGPGLGVELDREALEEYRCGATLELCCR